MLRSLSAMRTTVLLNCGNHSQLSSANAAAIIQAVAREIAEDFDWSVRQREAVVSLVAPYTTGTLAATLGSATLTGTGTTWTAAMVRRAITIDGAETYLRVATYVSGTQITLGDAQGAAVTWPYATAATATYSIFPLDYDLGTDVAKVLGGTEQWPLTEVSRAWIDAVDPQRTSRGTPEKYALTRTMLDSSGVTQRTFLELWPVASAASVLRVPYLCAPPALTGDNDLPVCPSQLIELLATSRCAQFIFAKTGDARWASMRDFYTGEYRTQSERLKADDESRQGLPMYLGGAPLAVSDDRRAMYDYGEDL